MNRLLNIPPDSNACALAIKNFGYLPEEICGRWSSELISYSGKEVALPHTLIVELLNSCNLDCPMCRVGKYGVNLERKLPLELFHKLLDELAGTLDLVRLNGLGESTLLPDFCDYLSLINKRGLTCELISNGSGLLHQYEQILEMQGVLLISWDAGEKHVFELLRRPAKWDEYLEKIQRLSEFAAHKGYSDRLFLLFTLQPKNIDQLFKLVLMCNAIQIRNIIVNVAKLPDDSWLSERSNEINDSLVRAQDCAKAHSINLLVPEQIGGEVMTGVEALKTSHSRCEMPWKEAVIRWNGDVQVCNMFNPFVYGNLYFNSFTQIWNNSFAQIFRKNVNTENMHPYCRNCVYMNDTYSHRHV